MFRLLIFLNLFPIITSAQDTINQISAKYPFLYLNENVIHNESALFTFFKKLNNSGDTVVPVVHLGDSHLQADHLSGRVRIELQKKFGNAGRGLVYPYRVARTNEPQNFKSWTNTSWGAKRVVATSNPLPIGVSGITIETFDTSSVINLKIKNQEGLDYSFNKFTLFHEKGAHAFDYTVCDEFSCDIGFINSLDTTSKLFSSSILPKNVDHIMLTCSARDTNARCARINGLMLENGNPGILYHMIGVNGAEYIHYNRSPLFWQQLGKLSPQLIIVSLGTNDAYPLSFQEDIFRNAIDSFVNLVRESSPGCSIILTTPGDSFKKTRKGFVRNGNMSKASRIIVNYCKENNIAYWDMFTMMGGAGSMKKWFAAGLSAKDRLHFNSRGYDLQGFLLFQALNKSFEKYLSNE